MAERRKGVMKGFRLPGDNHATSRFKLIVSRLQRSLVIRNLIKSSSRFDTCRTYKDGHRARPVYSPIAVVLTLCLSVMSVSVIGQSEVVLVSNWSQSVNATSMVDDERLQTFTTGSHTDGYILTRIQLDFVLKTTPDSFTVHLWSSSGNRPGNRIAILESTEIAVGEPTEFVSSSPVELDPDSRYFLHLAVKNPNDVLILKATKSGAEDRSQQATSWQIADNSIHIPSFGSTAWNTEASVIKIRIFGYERGIVQTESS